MFSNARHDEMFVVMSFDARYEERWATIFEPCVREDLRLHAVRVDYKESGDSTYTRILEGIARAKLVLVDITATWMWDDGKQTRWPQRNANVTWELGVAQVMKVPDEVLIVKSDEEMGLFDLAQFRTTQFEAGDPLEARRVIAAAARERLRSVQWMQSHRLEQLEASLPIEALIILLEATRPSGHAPFRPRKLEDVWLADVRRATLMRLLEVGAVESRIRPLTDEEVMQQEPRRAEWSDLCRYHATALGTALLRRMGPRVGVTDATIELLDKARQPKAMRHRSTRKHSVRKKR